MENSIKFQTPPNCGWIEYKLNDETVQHVWTCIEQTQGKSYKPTLVGQIDSSFQIQDIDDKLWRTVMQPCMSQYAQRWGNSHIPLVTNDPMDYKLDSFWVNYQKQHEYNPCHTHGGVYSFVIFMKIPTHFDEQAQHSNSADARNQYNSSFVFNTLDIFGVQRQSIYQLSPDYEGTLLFFPSQLNHMVYPYYNCEEQRITVSGNILQKTIKSQPLERHWT